LENVIFLNHFPKLRSYAQTPFPLKIVIETPPPHPLVSLAQPHPSKISRTNPFHLVFLTPNLDADLDTPIANLDAASIVDLAAALLAVEELYCDYPRGGLAIVMVLWVLKYVVWLFLVLIEWVLL
jgi:hypothetical protein